MPYIFSIILHIVQLTSPHVTQSDYYKQYVADYSNHIEWYEFNLGMAKMAKDQSKFVMLYEFGNDCIGCNEMDALTFVNPDVIFNLRKHFIASRAFVGMKEPGIIIYTPDGIPIIGFSGYMSGKNLAEMIEKISIIIDEKK